MGNLRLLFRFSFTFYSFFIRFFVRFRHRHTLPGVSCDVVQSHFLADFGQRLESVHDKFTKCKPFSKKFEKSRRRKINP